MRSALLAVFAALTLAIAFASSAMAATSGLQNSSGQSGPYDNTGRGPNESGLEGGGG
jgi:hypothetical protein